MCESALGQQAVGMAERTLMMYGKWISGVVDMRVFPMVTWKSRHE